MQKIDIKVDDFDFYQAPTYFMLVIANNAVFKYNRGKNENTFTFSYVDLTTKKEEKFKCVGYDFKLISKNIFSLDLKLKNNKEIKLVIDGAGIVTGAEFKETFLKSFLSQIDEASSETVEYLKANPLKAIIDDKDKVIFSPFISGEYIFGFDMSQLDLGIFCEHISKKKKYSVSNFRKYSQKKQPGGQITFELECSLESSSLKAIVIDVSAMNVSQVKEFEKAFEKFGDLTYEISRGK